MNRLSDATLNNMTKKELIEYVRMCEHNYDVAEETLRQQAENVKDWRPVKLAKWVKYPSIYRCSNCGNPKGMPKPYCELCGALMSDHFADAGKMVEEDEE